MKSILCIFIFFTIQFSALCQIKVGSIITAKELNLTPLNQAKIDRSKIIVLDFWATWCAPCIASFPHLADIQKSFQKKVQIIAVSDEPKIKVSNFLKKKNFALGFFEDSSKNLFKLFNIESRPLTAVVTQDGKLQWIGNSSDLELVLNEVVYGKGDINSLGLKVDYSNEKYYSATLSKPLEEMLYTYQISKSSPKDEYEAKTQKGTYTDSAINIYYRSASVSEVVQDLLNVSDLQLTNDRTDLDTILINITAKSTTSKISYNDGKETILVDLQKIFKFTIKKVYKTVDAYTFKIENRQKLLTFFEPIPGGGMVESTDGSYKITRLSLPELAGFFQKKLRTYISYEEKGSDKFNLQLKKFKTVEELNHLITEYCGLELIPTKIQVLTIELN